MTTFGKWLLGLLFFNSLGYALCLSHGHYHASAIEWIFFSGLLFNLGFFAKTTQPLHPDKALARLTALTLCFFCFLMAQDACLIYADKSSAAFYWFQWGNRLNWLFSMGVLALLLSSTPYQKGLRWLAAMMALLFLLNRVLVIFASPHPYIDVFTALNKASAALFAGQNPYTIQYEDLYHGAYGLQEPNLGYQPGIILPLAPFGALFHDIRFAYVVSDLLVGVLLFKISQRLRVPEVLSYLFPLLWLAFPVSYFVLEQAWTDLLLVSFTCGVLYAVLMERWVLAGALGGFLAASKFYPALVPLICAIYIYREYGGGPARRFISSLIAVTTLLFLPFLLNNAPALIHHTFTVFVNIAPRLDSFSLVALSFRKFSWPLPAWLDALAILLTVFATLLFLLKLKSKRFLYSVAAMGAIYFIFFMFAKQAFCNYYYYMAAFLLLVLLIQTGEPFVMPAKAGMTE